MPATPRLILRPWEESDLPAMANINATPEVMRYFPKLQTKEETAAFLKRQQAMQEEQGYCYFAAERKEDGRLIGFIGLSRQDFLDDRAPFTDIGWRLHPDFWGKGYATEGAEACLQYGFETIGLEEIFAVAPAINLPSIAVMHKLGMTRAGAFLHPALKATPWLESCVLYRKLPD